MIGSEIFEKWGGGARIFEKLGFVWGRGGIILSEMGIGRSFFNRGRGWGGDFFQYSWYGRGEGWM